MNNESFEELLRQAPAAPVSGMTSLVGVLAQSTEEGKFVLNLQDGSQVTLDKTAVSGHSVLGYSVGQAIVRVDVDSSKIPASSPATQAALASIRTVPQLDWTAAYWDNIHTRPWLDIHKVPWLDKIPESDLPQSTVGAADPIGPNTIAEGIPDPFGNAGYPVPNPWLTPFALATPHQVPASTLELMQGANPLLRKRPPGDGATGPFRVSTRQGLDHLTEYD
jgi:hypothetical protein